MEEEKLKYYSLSKYTCYEILMESQIASAGAHQARLIEKFKKNKNYIKTQFITLKIAFAFLFIVLPILPLVTFNQINDQMIQDIYSINSLFFVSSLLLVLYFGLTLLYSLMFGMISTSSFMSGNSFKWLQTLPFSKKNLKKIGIMTIFRNLDIPLIVLMAGLPIIMLIATQDIFIFLVSILTSVFNVIFNFSILVIIGEKMSFLFSESKTASKRANLVRTLTMLGYFVIMFTSSFIFSWGINAVENLFQIFADAEPNIFLVTLLGFIPYPFAPAYLVSLITIPSQLHWGIIFSSITGFALFIVIVWGLFKYAQKELHSVISTEIKIEKVEKRDLKIEIKPISPIKAYIRKDIISSTRDIQSFMFIFFPIFYPLILILTMSAPIRVEVSSIEGILVLWSIILAVYLFIPPMLIMGFLNLEESGSSTIASLPILIRDQAKAKILIMLIIQGLSLTITSIVLTILLKSIIVILLLLVTLPIAWTFLLFIFEMKVKLFGQMKYKYVLEELNKEHKIVKWISMILAEIGIYIIIFITGTSLIHFFGLEIAILTIGIIGAIALALLIFVFTRMFPKEKKNGEYITGGFLRKNVNCGTATLLILYFVFMFLVAPIEFLLLPILFDLPVLATLFIDFFINLGLLALLWLVVVPLGLKLPNKESFKEYTQTIKLVTFKPVWRNLLICITSIVVFGASTVFFAILLGSYSFDPSILLRNPKIESGGLRMGWFIFLFMIRAGLWEEVAFRGVILNLQLKKYSRTTSIILNGLFFGLFHLLNLLSGQNYYVTFMQVIFASFLGFSFAYMYTKTKSLIPCIIIHYLIDTIGQLFLNVSFPNLFNATLFLIFGIGVVPTFLIMIIVRLFAEERTDF
ncbi:MAG: type II CAAX prenyl endopeptidase Rce1 family protein [Candidatus Odinarchaeota archaeon]